MTARPWCCCTRPTWSATTTSRTVAKPQLERAGFKVDLQAMDWQTLVTRRTKKDPPQAGGWHAFFTSSGALSIPDPVAHFFLNAACEKAHSAGPAMPRSSAARRRMRATGDAESRGPSPIGRAAAGAEYPTYVPLGQFTVADGGAQERHRPPDGAGRRVLELEKK